MRLLEGDTALVTGAASGIGRGIARALAEEGARLVLTDLLSEPGRLVAEETGGQFIAADLTRPEAVAEVFDAALAARAQGCDGRAPATRGRGLPDGHLHKLAAFAGPLRRHWRSAP